MAASAQLLSDSLNVVIGRSADSTVVEWIRFGGRNPKIRLAEVEGRKDPLAVIGRVQQSSRICTRLCIFK